MSHYHPNSLKMLSVMFFPFVSSGYTFLVFLAEIVGCISTPLVLVLHHVTEMGSRQQSHTVRGKVLQELVEVGEPTVGFQLHQCCDGLPDQPGRYDGADLHSLQKSHCRMYFLSNSIFSSSSPGPRLILLVQNKVA